MKRKGINPEIIIVVLLHLLLRSGWSYGQDRRFLVDVYVNELKQSILADCLLDNEGGIWIKERDWRSLGIALLGEQSKIVEEQRYVSLRSYENIEYTFNEQTLALMLKIPAVYFSGTRLDLSSPNSDKIRPTVPGGFFNYDLSLQHINVQSQSNLTLISELGYFNRYGIGTMDFFVQNEEQGGGIQGVRLETVWTLDQPEKITTWHIGDSISSNIAWSGAVRFAGVQWQTNFSTQPYLITFPLPAFSGQAVVPTTLSIFVNDALSVTEEIKQGPFSLYDIPVVTGAGTVKVVTNDVIGRQRETIIPYYSSQQLLKKGLVDFSYEVGIIRNNYGIASFDYSQLMGVGTYMKGLSDHWTAGWHTEVLGSQQTLGIASDYLWGNWFVLSVGAAWSHNQAGMGSLLLLGIQRQTQTYGYGIQIMPCTKYFTELGWVEDQLAPSLQMQSFFMLGSPRWGNVSASYTVIDNRESEEAISPGGISILPSAKLLTLNYSHNLIKNLYFVLGSIIDFNQSSNNIGFFSLIWGFKKNYSLSATSSVQSGQTQQILLLNKDIPWGKGAGYHFSLSPGEPNQAEAFYAYQNDYGTYSGTVTKIGSQTYYLGEIMGSIVRFGGHTLFSRPLYESFAVVDASGFEDACIYNRNTCIGKTNKEGILLVPNLLPYQSNVVSIDIRDFPLKTQIPVFEREEIPYYRSGIFMHFPIKNVNNITMSLKQNNQTVVPMGAWVSVEGEEEAFPVVQNGQVFITTEKVGRIKGEAHWEDQACCFNLEVPDTAHPVLSLGEVRCYRER